MFKKIPNIVDNKIPWWVTTVGLWAWSVQSADVAWEGRQVQQKGEGIGAAYHRVCLLHSSNPNRTLLSFQSPL